MHVNDAFPSKYLKASDLQGKPATVTISSVEMEKIGNDAKMIIHFEGKQKGFVCNKTNANNIAKGLGGDTDEWVGQQIVLFPTTTDFQGETVDCIRIRMPLKASPNVTTSPKRVAQDADELNDSIPF